jgi:hypothetical protein
MAYRQYTKCVEPADKSGMNEYIQAVVAGLIAGGVAAAIAIAMGEPWCLLIALEIFALAGTIAFCEWWLYDRLVCLGGDREAIGMLVSIEPATGKSGLGAFDTDYSINLLTWNNPLGVSHSDAETTPPYGELIKEQHATKNLGLPFSGEFATDKASGKRSAILHAEFEGAGILDLQIGAKVGFGIAVAALLACVFIPGPIGAAIAAILALLALIAAAIGAAIGLGDTGSPADVDPNLGSLHTNDPANGGIGADLLYVYGTWVYDSFHTGWNEIHPIKICARVGRWDGDWPEDWGATVDGINDAFDDARSDDTKDNQDDPEHDWDVHPDVDGCEGEDEEEDEPVIH